MLPKWMSIDIYVKENVHKHLSYNNKIIVIYILINNMDFNIKNNYVEYWYKYYTSYYTM